MKKLYFPGSVINGLEIIKENPEYGTKNRVVTFKCYCGKKFTCVLKNAVSGHTKSCGCYNIESHTKKDSIKKGGIYKNIYAPIIQKCNNPKNIWYKNYGQKGIKLSDEFKEFQNFYDYVKSLPDFEKRIPENLMLIRINKNGNFERGNLAWSKTTKHKLSEASISVQGGAL